MPGFGTGSIGPEWICIFDPSGDFLNNRFTFTDLRYTAAAHNWPEGITWRHIKHPNRLKRYTSSKLISIKDQSHGRSSLYLDNQTAH